MLEQPELRPWSVGAAGRRRERDARAAHATTRRHGRRAREDGHDRPRFGALGLRRRPLRLRGDPERRSRSPPGPPVRRRTASRPRSRVSALGETAARPRRGSGRRPSRPSPPWSPGSRRRRRRSSSWRRCRRPSRRAPRAPPSPRSRDNDSSVPVITYCVPVSGPSTGRSSSPASKRRPMARSSLDERAVVLVGEPLGDRLGALGPDPLALRDLLLASLRAACRRRRSAGRGSGR